MSDKGQSKVLVTGKATPDEAPGIDFRHRRKPHEEVIRVLLFAFAAVSILTTIGIVVILGRESWLFFGDPRVTIREFFGSTRWQPQIEQFGVWPLVTATFTTSTIAMLVAGPLGLFVAIYLSEYASQSVRSILKPILEVLSGIPTVVYGYFALTFMTPLLRSIFGTGVVEIYNTASAGLVMGILILPLVSSLAE
ncbi:MAG: PstC family ABC transporter permease, partial [Spirochaetota bacterium]